MDAQQKSTEVWPEGDVIVNQTGNQTGNQDIFCADILDLFDPGLFEDIDFADIQEQPPPIVPQNIPTFLEDQDLDVSEDETNVGRMGGGQPSQSRQTRASSGVRPVPYGATLSGSRAVDTSPILTSEVSTPEGRERQKKERNKYHAVQSRLRRNQRRTDLEQEIAELEVANGRLREEIMTAYSLVQYDLNVLFKHSCDHCGD